MGDKKRRQETLLPCFLPLLMVKGTEPTTSIRKILTWEKVFVKVVNESQFLIGIPLLR